MKPILLALATVALSTSALADSFTFSNGTPDGRMGMASRPGNGVLEIEAADDFILTAPTAITSASFYGLVPNGASIANVTVEIYRVFPQDSKVPPSGNVPTRNNSPSDVAFASRDSSTPSELAFSTASLGAFSVSNSVVNGIHPSPSQTTGGEGPVSGTEVLISTLFPDAFDLPANHYFFVPQVELSNGTFLWLSSAFPNAALSTDLQTWIRDGHLDPDWLRVGTDIVGGGANAPKFNGAFSLAGNPSPVPEPGTLLLSLTGGAAALLGCLRRRLPA